MSEPYIPPHGPNDPCTCPGCWACEGNEIGCTCDIDWDEMFESRYLAWV